MSSRSLRLGAPRAGRRSPPWRWARRSPLPLASASLRSGPKSEQQLKRLLRRSLTPQLEGIAADRLLMLAIAITMALPLRLLPAVTVLLTSAIIATAMAIGLTIAPRRRRPERRFEIYISNIETSWFIELLLFLEFFRMLLFITCVKCCNKQPC